MLLFTFEGQTGHLISNNFPILFDNSLNVYLLLLLCTTMSFNYHNDLEGLLCEMHLELFYPVIVTMICNNLNERLIAIPDVVDSDNFA